MKKIIVLILAFFVVGCGADNDDGSSSEWVEITVQDSDVISSGRAKGEITSLGEVDRYAVDINDINRKVQIKCTSDTMRPNVDLLVNVFEMDANGDLRMLAGDHAPDGGLDTVNLKVTVNVTQPKRLYITVRDLLDNDKSSGCPYYISASYEAVEDGNNTFETSEILTIGGDALDGAIGSVDDVDVFGLAVAEDGVYDILVEMNRLEGSSVELKIQIYNEEGEVIETRTQEKGESNTSHLIHYLTAGEYYVAISEDGKDNSDHSVYFVSVNTVVSTEMGENDTAEAADSLSQAFDDITGSIDYADDADFYAIDSDVAGDLKIMNLAFESESSFKFLIELYDASDVDNPAFSHIYDGDVGVGTFNAVLKLASDADYVLKISAADKTTVTGVNPYTFSGNVEGITDADEADGGNDVEANAIDLSAEPTHDGKISYSRDNDWYKITFPFSATSKQVLSLNLDVPSTDVVQYAMKITGPGIATEKILYHSHQEMRGVDLKTGILVPTGEDDATYMIKVYDYQNNDSDPNAVFTVSWSVVNDTTTEPAACPKGGDTDYHDENTEDNDVEWDGLSSDAVKIFYPSTLWKIFGADMDVLDLASEDATQSVVGNTVVIQFPWVSGYVDYDGDEDWFFLDLSKPLNEGDTTWYYEVDIEFYEQNETVEYALEFMPDSDGSKVVSLYQGDMDTCQDRFICPTGVLGLITEADGENTIDYRLYAEEDRFLWVGSGDGSTWSGKNYIRISDFNYLKTDEETYNTEPDNDWGNDAPYYFRITLTYHNDAAAPSYAPRATN